MNQDRERELFRGNRREFLQGGLAVGASLIVGFSWGGRLSALAGANAASGSSAGPWAPNAFVRITPDGVVTVLSKHIEFGQGTYTGLATMVAEELGCSWDQIRVESSPADTEVYANLAFGAQGTGGSTAMANSWEQMRRAGATARVLLLGAAAEAWGVEAETLDLIDGEIVERGSSADPEDRSGRRAPLGDFVEAASQREAPESVALKDPKDFRLIGKDLPRVDVRAKTDGSAIFTIDHQLPGVLTALLARPPRFGARVASFDAKDTKKIDGVTDVVEVPRGVAVVAKDFWSAKRGRDALRVTWDESQAEFRSSDEIMARYRALAETHGTPAAQRGDVETALEASGENVLEATYEFPFLAHAPMEPLDAVARLDDDGGCTLFFGSQLQTVDQSVCAEMLGVEPSKVRIETLLGGGSFGRRATPDADIASEALSVAQAIDGRAPVKVLWTREDDIQGGRYRPMYLHRLRGAVGADGAIDVWQQRIVGQSIQRGTPFEAFLIKEGLDQTSIEGASNLPYAVPNFHVDLVTTHIGVPPLWWRSVGHTHTAYATETFLDRLARQAGRDPVEMRLALLGDEHPRAKAVIEAAAEAADWGRERSGGRALGIGFQESFGSFVAQVAEVSVGDDGLPKVHKVWCAVDCGIALNPDNIRAQMEGGIGYGLGAVLYDEVILDNGRVVTHNFHDYRSLRIHEMPEVEVVIVPSAEAPTGVGEPGVPPIAPAVANAWAVLTGVTVERLPFTRAQAEGAWS